MVEDHHESYVLSLSSIIYFKMVEDHHESYVLSLSPDTRGAVGESGIRRQRRPQPPTFTPSSPLH